MSIAKRFWLRDCDVGIISSEMPDIESSGSELKQTLTERVGKVVCFFSRPRAASSVVVVFLSPQKIAAGTKSMDVMLPMVT